LTKLNGAFCQTERGWCTSHFDVLNVSSQEVTEEFLENFLSFVSQLFEVKCGVVLFHVQNRTSTTRLREKHVWRLTSPLNDGVLSGFYLILQVAFEFVDLLAKLLDFLVLFRLKEILGRICLTDFSSDLPLHAL
jgi:hypothetical protein